MNNTFRSFPHSIVEIENYQIIIKTNIISIAGTPGISSTICNTTGLQLITIVDKFSNATNTKKVEVSNVLVDLRNILQRARLMEPTDRFLYRRSSREGKETFSQIDDETNICISGILDDDFLYKKYQSSEQQEFARRFLRGMTVDSVTGK